MNASYRNNKVETRAQSVQDNVDILFSIVGGSKPPILPLREERQTDGVELVYNARGTGYSAVCKEQKRREEMLLEKLKRLERKLERKASYKRTKKRQKALNMVKELKYQLENSANGISYQTYLDELRQMRRSLRTKPLPSDEESQASEGTINMETKVMRALQTLYDDPEIGLDNIDSEADRSNDSSTALNANNSTFSNNANSIAQEESANDNDDEGRDDQGATKNASNDSMAMAEKTTTSGERSNLETIDNCANLSPAKPGGVRFKDIKPTMDDNLARAKALVTSAKFLQRSFSNDSNVSLENYQTPSTRTLIESTENEPEIRHKYAADNDKEIICEKDRYHLFVSHPCIWSHRCLVVRALKRLQDVVTISYVECKFFPHSLWEGDVAIETDSDLSFWSITGKHEEDDTLFKALKIHYLDGLTSDPVHVPILWDKKEKSVVSQKSPEIMKLLNFEFNTFSKRPKLNLFPAGFKTENESIDKWLHTKLYTAIYRCGLAKTQAQYDEAVEDVTAALDKADLIVKKRGFLAGPKLTESDILLFTTLLRFDEIYRVLFRINTRMIAKMPGLMGFMKDIYQVKGIPDTCKMEKMKQGFFGAQGETYIVPRGASFIKLLSNTDAI